MKIRQILQPDAVIGELSGRSKRDLLGALCDPAVRRYPGLRPERFLETLVEREKLSSTGLEGGVAIPHGKLAGLPTIVGVFGRSVPGVDFESLDGKPAHLFFAIFAPEAAGGDHLRVLARVSRILKAPSVRERILAAADATEIYRIVCEEDDRF